MPDQTLTIAVLAHNEERHIADCLNSLPLGAAGTEIYVVVNGSTDATASIAKSYADRYDNLSALEFAEGGKARSWNRFVFEELDEYSDVHAFVDGDTVIAPGAFDALVRSLASNAVANAVTGMPLAGRNVEIYREAIAEERGLVGDLYAIRGVFLQRMRDSAIRMPVDLIGDDGLIGALVKTDLGTDSDWNDERVAQCTEAGFRCEPTDFSKPHTIGVQYRRMINYSVRHFQNCIITDIMRKSGAPALPRHLTSLYPDYLPTFRPRRSPTYWWFDRLALKKMARDAAVSSMSAEQLASG